MERDGDQIRESSWGNSPTHPDQVLAHSPSFHPCISTLTDQSSVESTQVFQVRYEEEIAAAYGRDSLVVKVPADEHGADLGRKSNHSCAGFAVCGFKQDDPNQLHGTDEKALHTEMQVALA